MSTVSVGQCKNECSGMFPEMENMESLNSAGSTSLFIPITQVLTIKENILKNPFLLNTI